VGTHRRKCYFITSAYFSALTVESPVARFPLSGLLRKLDSNMALEENNWIPAAVFGGSLVLLGAGMMYGHARAWQQQRADESLEDADRQHLRNRYLRRMQTSAVVAFTGCLIGIGDAFIWQLGPAVATFYWLFVIMLVFWISLLALGDLTSVRTHSQTAMTQLEATRKELESELAKHRHRSNGKPTQRITDDSPDSPKQNQPNTLQEPR
jgi:hypothetical protein